MDDTAIQKFFTQPTQTYHRRYEALRAVIVDDRSQKDVAEEFGFQYHTLRQLVSEFRRDFDAEQASTVPPFFGSSPESVGETKRRVDFVRKVRAKECWVLVEEGMGRFDPMPGENILPP